MHGSVSPLCCRLQYLSRQLFSVGCHCTVVLSKAGRVYQLGGEDRTVTEIKLTEEISLVAALLTSAVLLTNTGTIISIQFGKKKTKSKIKFDELEERSMKPVLLVKHKDTCLLHFQLT